MAIVTWRDMIPPLTPLLPDCPVFTVLDALQRAAGTFYDQSRAWRVDDFTVATTVLDQAEYTVAGLPSNSELAGVPALWVGEDEVHEATAADAGAAQPGVSDDTWTVAVSGPAKIKLTPPPLIAGKVIKGTIALKPAAAATGIDSDLYHWRRHREAIEAATLAELMGQVGKPWSNPQMALVMAAEAKRHALRCASAAGPKSRRPRLRVTPA